VGLATGLWFCMILLFAAFAATVPGGDVLGPEYGYSYTLQQSLLVHGLKLGLPPERVGNGQRSG